MVRKRPLTEVVVFGRDPRSGAVKTRLAATVGADRAARVYRVLLEHTLAVAEASGFDYRLSMAVEPVEPPTDVPWEVQPQGDLGVRLRASFDRAFRRGARRVLVVGSDCPELADSHLRSAARALDGRLLVLGPAADGGYWLIGQRAPGAPALLEDIPWSTERTRDVTVAKARRMGLDPVLLDELVDVDTIEDLANLRRRGRMPQEVDAAVRSVLEA